MFFSSECKTIRKQLWDRANGSLPTSDITRVETHLHGCEACRQEAESYQQTVALMAHFRQETVPISQKGWRDLEARLDTASRTQRHSLFPTLAWGGGLVASAALLLLFLAPGLHSTNSLSPLTGQSRTSSNVFSSRPLNRDSSKEIASSQTGSSSPYTNIGDDDYPENLAGTVSPEIQHRLSPPAVNSLHSVPHGHLVRTGPIPTGLKPAPPTHHQPIDTGEADSGSIQQVRVNNVMPAVVSSYADGQDHSYVIDHISSPTSGTNSGSDGSEEQHPL